MSDLLLGVGVLIWRGPDLLMLKRAGAHGAGTWSVPGGHIDPGEWPDDAARREMREETGLEPLAELHPVSFDWSDFPSVGRRYVTLIFAAAVARTAEYELREPTKAERMIWVRPGALPRPLFQPLEMLFRAEPKVLQRARDLVMCR